jgi:ribosomal protein L14E/L6E/L27E
VIHVRDGRIASDEKVKDRWDAAEVLRTLPVVSTEIDDLESIEEEKEPI